MKNRFHRLGSGVGCLLLLAAAGCDDNNPSGPGSDISWERTDGPNGGHIRALTVDSDGTLFAGGLNLVLFRSTDSGGTWTQANFWANEHVNVLAATGTTAYAGTHGGYVLRWTEGHWVQMTSPGGSVQALLLRSTNDLFAGTASGVYRSTDGGESWNQLLVSVGGSHFLALASNSAGVLFAGSGGFSSPGSVWISTDDGASWSEQEAAPSSINVIAVDGNDQIFAGSSGDGIFRSPDGVVWSSVGLGGRSIRALAIDSSGQIFCSTDHLGVFRSTDDGESWILANDGLPAADVPCLVTDQADRIYAGLEGQAVFRSTDSGETWQHASSGISAGSVAALTGDGQGMLFAGTSFGVHRSSDGGFTWSPSGPVDFVGALIIDSAGYLFAGAREGLHRSSDSGETWELLDPGPATAYSLAASPDEPVFAGTTRGISRSTDHGDTWIEINEGLGVNLNIESLTVAPNGHVWAGTGTSTGRLFRSENDGDSWTEVHSFDERVEAILCLPDGEMFIGTSGQGVLRSTDEGATWLETGRSFIFVECLAVDPEGDVFFGGSGGVMLSENNGESWHEITTGLHPSNSLTVAALLIEPAGKLLAGTYGFGLYRTADPVTP